jgi:uncharacterized membrane protein
MRRQGNCILINFFKFLLFFLFSFYFRRNILEAHELLHLLTCVYIVCVTSPLSPHFNQCLKGWTLTLEQGEPEQLAPSHLLDAKLQKQGDHLLDAKLQKQGD